MARRFLAPSLFAAPVAGIFCLAIWWAAISQVAGAAPTAGQATASCTPAISGTTVFHAGPDPSVTISGSCFGAGEAVTAGDSQAFRVSDLGPNGRLSEIERELRTAPPARPLLRACPQKRSLPARRPSLPRPHGGTPARRVLMPSTSAPQTRSPPRSRAGPTAPSRCWRSTASTARTASPCARLTSSGRAGRPTRHS